MIVLLIFVFCIIKDKHSSDGLIIRHTNYLDLFNVTEIDKILVINI